MRLLGSDLQDTVVVTDSFLNWLRITRKNLTDASKKLLWYCYILCDKYERSDDILIEVGEVTSFDTCYRVTIDSTDLNYLMKSSGIIESESLEVVTKGKNRTKEEIYKIVGELGSIALLEVTDDHIKAVSFASVVEYVKKSGTFYIDVNKEFIVAMREAVEFSQVYGRLQSATSYILTNGELLLYAWIVMNDKAIETQKIRGNIDYTGVNFSELCSRLGLSGRPIDNKKVVDRCLEGINKKLGLHIKSFPYYKGRRLTRIRFYCEEGGVHVGKYFGKKKIDNGRPTNILVNLYKIKYENYYGCKLSEREENKLHFAIVEFFKSHSLDFKKEEDKDWFIDNVLDVLFERYDNLGYSTPDFPRFCANNLKTWVIDNIINEIPNKKKEDKNSLTGKVGTVPMEHQDWMDEVREFTEDEWEEKY